MPTNALTGNYSVDDLLAVRLASAAEYGTDKIFNVLQKDLQFYNGVVSDQLNLLADPVTEQTRVFGGSTLHEMTEIDEYGVAPSKKAFGTNNVSFPLSLYSSSIGWTQKYLDIATPAEIASEYLAVRAGHSYEVNKQIKKAIYNNTNVTFADKLTNGVSLTIRRFWNNDGQTIPDSSSGSFATSHTHYNACGSTLANTDIQGLIDTVTEHDNTKGLKIIIHLSNKAAVSALSDFVSLANPILVYNASDVARMSLDNSDLNNQLIGFWAKTGVEIWVKPWAVANYALCIATDVGEKPLGFRQRQQPSLQGLRLVSEIPGYPLVSKSFESEFGFGVLNRGAGAVLMLTDTSWANPTIS